MNNEEFVAQDTKYLQIRSVCAFMEVFGYKLMFNGKFYHEAFFNMYKVKPTFKGCNNISFNTAVKLHNGSYTDWHGDKFRAPFETDKYTFNKARTAKIVQQVFLQGTKHGQVVCHKHLVKFTDPSYQYMFLEQGK